MHQGNILKTHGFFESDTLVDDRISQVETRHLSFLETSLTKRVTCTIREVGRSWEHKEHPTPIEYEKQNLYVYFTGMYLVGVSGYIHFLEAVASLHVICHTRESPNDQPTNHYYKN